MYEGRDALTKLTVVANLSIACVPNLQCYTVNYISINKVGKKYKQKAVALPAQIYVY